MERITIAGAGLVGCVLSMLLVKRGYRVTVVDRNPDPRDTPFRKNGKAVNLTLCTRGLKALDTLELAAAVQRISVPAYGRCVHDADGVITWQPYGNDGEALYSVQRYDLGKLLIEQAEQNHIDLRFNQKCTAINWSPFSIELEDTVTGRTWREATDRVIGADGAFSTVRKMLQTGGRFNYSQEFLDQGYKEITIPASAAAEWMQRRTALHMWPRHQFMLISFPNPDGSFTCSLHMPFEGETSLAVLNSRERIETFFQSTFPDVHGHIPDLAEQFMNSPANPMVTVRCAPWSVQNKVTLIGDAAHVLLPYYGQGANAGFEDCAVLMQGLDRAGGDWDSALRQYEQTRKPDMDVIADLCKTHYIELRRHLADPLFLFRKRIERRANEKYPHRYQSLYSMIAFTCMSYREAVTIDGEQRRMIDQILAAADVDLNWSQERIDAGIERVMQPATCYSPTLAQTQGV